MKKSLKQAVIRTVAGAVIGVLLDEASQMVERYRNRNEESMTKGSPHRVEVLHGTVMEPVDHVEVVAKKVIDWFQQSDVSENIRELVHRAREMDSSGKTGSAASRFAESAVDSARQAWTRRA